MTRREIYLQIKRELRRKNVRLMAERLLLIPLGILKFLALLFDNSDIEAIRREYEKMKGKDDGHN